MNVVPLHAGHRSLYRMEALERKNYRGSHMSVVEAQKLVVEDWLELKAHVEGFGRKRYRCQNWNQMHPRLLGSKEVASRF